MILFAASDILTLFGKPVSRVIILSPCKETHSISLLDSKISVCHNIQISVDSSKEMLGTFSPQPEPYTHEMPEETTPSGYFARGSYTAKTKVIQVITFFLW